MKYLRKFGIMFLAAAAVILAASPALAETVSYIDENGDMKMTDATVIGDINYPMTLTEEWYVLSTVYWRDRVTFSGNVHLILDNGGTTYAEKGITVPPGSSLTIYTGVTGGSLVATGTDGNAGIGGEIAYPNSGTITIHGGVITATGDGGNPGIGAATGGTADSVAINSGIVSENGQAFTVYSDSTLPRMYSFPAGSTLASNGGTPRTLTVAENAYIDASRLDVGASTNITFVNNGTIMMPPTMTAEELKSLRMTGTGMVDIGGVYYDNSGDTKAASIRIDQTTVGTVSGPTSILWGAKGTYAATPSPGYEFTKWNLFFEPNMEEGGGSHIFNVNGSYLEIDVPNPAAFLNGVSIRISAEFTQIAADTHDITVTISPEGAGTAAVSPESAAEGEPVWITARPADGYKLVSITVLDANGDPVEVYADGEFEMPAGDAEVYVEFEIDENVHDINVTVSPEGAGTAAVIPEKAAEGETVTITARPAANYRISRITVTDEYGNPVEVSAGGNSVAANAAGEFKMPAGDAEVHVEFRLAGDEHNITVTVSPEDAGTAAVSPEKASEGETVRITAYPAANYKLASITVTDAGGRAVTVDAAGEFRMPAGDANVHVEFSLAGGAGSPITGFRITGLPSEPSEDSVHEIGIVWMLGNDAEVRAAELKASAAGTPDPAPTVKWSVSPPNGTWPLSVTPRGSDGATLKIGKAGTDAPAQQCELIVEVSQEGGFSETLVCKFYAGSFRSPVSVPDGAREAIDETNSELAKDGVFITPGNNVGTLPQTTLDAVTEWLRDCLVTYGTTPERNTNLTPVVQLDAIGGVNSIETQKTDSDSLPLGYEDAGKPAPYIDMALPDKDDDVIEVLPMTYSVRFTQEELAAVIGEDKASAAVANPTRNLGAIFGGIVLHMRTTEGPMGFDGPNGSYYTRLMRGIANPENAVRSGMASVTGDGASITITLSFFLLNYHGEAFIVDNKLFIPDGLRNDRLTAPTIWAHRREISAEPGGGGGGGSGCSSQVFPLLPAAVTLIFLRRRAADRTR